MNAERRDPLDERTQGALAELQGLIQARYPEATFSVSPGEDPPGLYLRATVDVEDIDEVIDVFGDRLLELQVDERLPIYVIPLEPVERVMERMRAPRRSSQHRAMDLSPEPRTAPETQVREG